MDVGAGVSAKEAKGRKKVKRITATVMKVSSLRVTLRFLITVRISPPYEYFQ
jgi:hypothetical protein